MRCKLMLQWHRPSKSFPALPSDLKMAERLATWVIGIHPFLKKICHSLHDLGDYYHISASDGLIASLAEAAKLSPDERHIELTIHDSLKPLLLVLGVYNIQKKLVVGSCHYLQLSETSSLRVVRVLHLRMLPAM